MKAGTYPANIEKIVHFSILEAPLQEVTQKFGETFKRGGRNGPCPNRGGKGEKIKGGRRKGVLSGTKKRSDHHGIGEKDSMTKQKTSDGTAQ